MISELKIPYTPEDIKNAFERGDRDTGIIMASSSLCYLTGINELSNELKKDGRLDPGIAKDLEEFNAKVLGVSATLMALAQLNKTE